MQQARVATSADVASQPPHVAKLFQRSILADQNSCNSELSVVHGLKLGSVPTTFDQRMIIRKRTFFFLRGMYKKDKVEEACVYV